MSDKQTALVLGAGVIGVTTAYYLASAGLKVTVIDRQEGPGLEASFANGGQISASHSEPWAGPSALPQFLKWLGRSDAPLLFRLKADPALWSWCLWFLANCNGRAAAINLERMLRVALLSRQELITLRQQTKIEYDHLGTGILHIYENPRECSRAQRLADHMNKLGLNRETVSVQDCVHIEPALEFARSRGLLAGGTYTPDDESGDAYKFTTELAALAGDLGVEFHYGQNIEQILTRSHRVEGVRCANQTFSAGQYVLALGSYSPLLLKPLGIRLPVYPAKGYSATLPLAPTATAPTVSLIQDEKKLVYSRLGNRLRVAGTAEIAGYDTALTPARTDLIVKAALELFPKAGDADGAELWAGLRSKTPDSVPVIGATALTNLFLNTGHGTLGWTMACGSARLITDLVLERAPAVSMDGLSLERF